MGENTRTALIGIIVEDAGSVEEDQDTVSALSGKLGALKGVSTKTIYSKN